MKMYRALGLHNISNCPMYNMCYIINKSKIKQGAQRAIYRSPEYNVPPF